MSEEETTDRAEKRRASEQEAISDAKKLLRRAGLGGVGELREVFDSLKIREELKSFWLLRSVSILTGLAALASVVVLILQSSVSFKLDAREVLQTKLDNLERDVRSVTKELEAEKKTLRAAEEQTAKERAEKTRLEAENKKLEEDNKTLRGKKKTTENELRSSIRKLQQSMVAESSTEAKVEAALTGMRQANAALQGQVDSLVNEKAQLDRDAKVAQEANKSLTTAMEAVRRELAIANVSHELVKEAGLSRFKGSLSRGGQGFSLGDFTVTLYNTGDYERNVDLKVVDAEGKNEEKLRDMLVGKWYYHRFSPQDRLFLIHPIAVKQSDKEDDEEATVEVFLLDREFHRAY